MYEYTHDTRMARTIGCPPIKPQLLAIAFEHYIDHIIIIIMILDKFHLFRIMFRPANSIQNWLVPTDDVYACCIQSKINRNDRIGSVELDLG